MHRARGLSEQFDFGLPCETVLSTTFIKTSTERISFGRIMFVFPVQFQRLVDFMLKNTEAVLTARDDPTPY